MAKHEPQFKVLVPDDVLEKLDTQRKALGFHTANALSSVYLAALADVPPSKVWQALAHIRRYQEPTTRRLLTHRKSAGC